MLHSILQFDIAGGQLSQILLVRQNTDSCCLQLRS